MPPRRAVNVAHRGVDRSLSRAQDYVERGVNARAQAVALRRAGGPILQPGMDESDMVSARGSKRSRSSYDADDLGPVRNVRSKPVSNINTLTYCVKQKKKTRNVDEEVISFQVKGKTRYRMSAKCAECGSKKCTFLKSGNNPPATVSGGKIEKGYWTNFAQKYKDAKLQDNVVKSGGKVRGKGFIMGENGLTRPDAAELARRAGLPKGYNGHAGPKSQPKAIGRGISTAVKRAPRKRKSVGAMQTVGGDFNPSTASFW